MDLSVTIFSLLVIMQQQSRVRGVTIQGLNKSLVLRFDNSLEKEPRNVLFEKRGGSDCRFRVKYSASEKRMMR